MSYDWERIEAHGEVLCRVFEVGCHGELVALCENESIATLVTDALNKVGELRRGFKDPASVIRQLLERPDSELGVDEDGAGRAA